MRKIVISGVSCCISPAVVVVWILGLDVDWFDGISLVTWCQSTLHWPWHVHYVFSYLQPNERVLFNARVCTVFNILYEYECFILLNKTFAMLAMGLCHSDWSLWSYKQLNNELLAYISSILKKFVCSWLASSCSGRICVSNIYSRHTNWVVLVCVATEHLKQVQSFQLR